MFYSSTISANGVSNVLKGRVSNALWATFTVSGVPTGGSPTLDVYLQHSGDQGATWRDLAHPSQWTTTTSTVFCGVSGYLTGGVTFLATSDAALAANTVVQGPYGDYLRIKYVCTAGNSGAYTLSVLISEKI